MFQKTHKTLLVITAESPKVEEQVWASQVGRLHCVDKLRISFSNIKRLGSFWMYVTCVSVGNLPSMWNAQNTCDSSSVTVITTILRQAVPSSGNAWGVVQRPKNLACLKAACAAFACRRQPQSEWACLGCADPKQQWSNCLPQLTQVGNVDSLQLNFNIFVALLLHFLHSSMQGSKAGHLLQCRLGNALWEHSKRGIQVQQRFWAAEIRAMSSGFMRSRKQAI